MFKVLLSLLVFHQANVNGNDSAAEFLSIIDSVYQDPMYPPVHTRSDIMAEMGEERSKSAYTAQNPNLKSRQDLDTGNGLIERLARTVMSIFGVEETTVGRMAINVLAYLGELFANYLVGPTKRMGNTLSQYRSMATKGMMPFMSELMVKAQRRGQEIQKSLLEEELMTNMIDTLQKKTGKTTSCVQLFLCKMNPVVQGVQRAVKTSDDGYGYRSMYRSSTALVGRMWENAPSLQHYRQLGRDCEIQFPTCPLLEFGNEI